MIIEGINKLDNNKSYYVLHSRCSVSRYGLSMKSSEPIVEFFLDSSKYEVVTFFDNKSGVFTSEVDKMINFINEKVKDGFEVIVPYDISFRDKNDIVSSYNSKVYRGSSYIMKEEVDPMLFITDTRTLMSVLTLEERYLNSAGVSLFYSKKDLSSVSTVNSSCNHKNKYFNVISGSLKFWVCPDCKVELWIDLNKN